MVRHCAVVIDDHHIAASAVARGEPATGHDRNAQRLEVLALDA
jgi:hypothetical protein